MERRVEPKPAFRHLFIAKGRLLHLDISDQELFLKRLALKAQPHAFPCGGPGTVTSDIPIGFQCVTAIGCFYGQRDMVAVVFMCDGLVQEPDVDQVGKFPRSVHQVLFDIVLLQVDEGRVPVAFFRQQVKGKHLIAAMELAAYFPGYALVQHAFAHAKPVKYFQRPFRPADCAGAHGHNVVVIEHN